MSNPDANLANVVAPFFNEYSRAVVLNSKSKVVWTQVPNQLGFEQRLYNQPLPSGETESNLAVLEPTIDGTVYFTQCRSTTADSTSDMPLHNATNLYDLKNRTPGISMRRLQCSKYSNKGMTQMATYNPKTAFNYKDIKDNLEALQFQTGQNPLRGAYNTCAINKYVPVSPTNPKQIPLFEAEVLVNYNIEFYRRNNHIGSNNAIPITPHHGDL
jgi:hypothetical protein